MNNIEDRIIRALRMEDGVNPETGEVIHNTENYRSLWCGCEVEWEAFCVWCEEIHQIVDHREIDMPASWHEWMVQVCRK